MWDFGPDNHGFDLPGGGLINLQKSDQPGRIDHFCIGVDDFDAERLRTRVKGAGVEDVQGNASDNFSVSDPDGLRVQVSASDWAASGARKLAFCRATFRNADLAGLIRAAGAVYTINKGLLLQIASRVAQRLSKPSVRNTIPVFPYAARPVVHGVGVNPNSASKEMRSKNEGWNRHNSNNVDNVTFRKVLTNGFIVSIITAGHSDSMEILQVSARLVRKTAYPWPTLATDFRCTSTEFAGR
jgi:hypothetical protein